MYMEEDDNFQEAASGAANTVPKQCSALRKNGFVVIRGHPCKIVQMSTSKTGKHGHAKVHLVGLDIFTSKKFEDICPSTHNMNVPKVTRQEYTVLYVSADGYLTLMDDGGELVRHLRVTDACSHSTVSVVQALLQRAEDADRIVTAQVMSALGEEVVKELRVAKG